MDQKLAGRVACETVFSPEHLTDWLAELAYERARPESNYWTEDRDESVLRTACDIAAQRGQRYIPSPSTMRDLIALQMMQRGSL